MGAVLEGAAEGGVVEGRRLEHEGTAVEQARGRRVHEPVAVAGQDDRTGHRGGPHDGLRVDHVEHGDRRQLRIRPVTAGRSEGRGLAQPRRRRFERVPSLRRRGCVEAAGLLEVGPQDHRADPEEPGDGRQRAGLERPLLQPPVEGVEEVDRRRGASRQDLTGEVGPVGEAGRDRVDGGAPSIGGEARARELEDPRARGRRASSAPMASLPVGGHLLGASHARRTGTRSARRAAGPRARARRPHRGRRAARRGRGSAATAAARSPASPSTTIGTTRGLLRRARPSEVSLVKVLHSDPYGVGSSIRPRAHGDDGAHDDEQGEVGAMGPAQEQRGHERRPPGRRSSARPPARSLLA